MDAQRWRAGWAVGVALWLCGWGCAEDRAAEEDGHTHGPSHCAQDQDGDRAFTGSAQCMEGMGAGDCDDSDPTVSPSAQEVCDGKDNDCDGQVDEDLPPLTCPKTEGVCGEGDRAPTYACQAGAQDAAACEVGCEASAFSDGCGYGPRYVQAEDGAQEPAHCDGADNDCDGQVDEGCAPVCAVGTPCGGFVCGDNVPADQCPCQAQGTIQCAADGLAACQDTSGKPIPSPFDDVETPNDGLDNNCDGVIDEAP